MMGQPSGTWGTGPFTIPPEVGMVYSPAAVPSQPYGAPATAPPPPPVAPGVTRVRVTVQARWSIG